MANLSSKISGQISGDFFGAFADTAVLLPLLATLSIHNGMNFAFLLFSAGALYILSGYFYKIPMSVQPLKSIAIAGITLGATQIEIRISAALLGVMLLSLIFLNLKKIEESVPKVLIHGIQLSLGLLLIIQGLKQIPLLDSWSITLGILSLMVLLSLDQITKFPTLGWFSVIAIFMALFSADSVVSSEQTQSIKNHFIVSEIRWSLILSLLIPQFLLTINNSVLATKDVAHRYFEAKARKVTIKNLLQFIGLGNLLMSLLGGLPFCHGSGGVTAHYKGGATSNHSNYIIGSFLLLVSIFSYFQSIQTLVLFPVFLFIILTSVGVFHFKLAKPSWQNSSKLTLIGMGITTVLSQNILLSFTVGLIIYMAEKYICLNIKKPL